MNSDLLRQALAFVDDRDEYEALSQPEEPVEPREEYDLREDFEYTV